MMWKLFHYIRMDPTNIICLKIRTINIQLKAWRFFLFFCKGSRRDFSSSFLGHIHGNGYVHTWNWLNVILFDGGNHIFHSPHWQIIEFNIANVTLPCHYCRWNGILNVLKCKEDGLISPSVTKYMVSIFWT